MGAISSRIKAFIISFIPLAWLILWFNGKVSFLFVIKREFPFVGEILSLILGMPEDEDDDYEEKGETATINVTDQEGNTATVKVSKNSNTANIVSGNLEAGGNEFIDYGSGGFTGKITRSGKIKSKHLDSLKAAAGINMDSNNDNNTQRDNRTNKRSEKRSSNQNPATKMNKLRNDNRGQGSLANLIPSSNPLSMPGGKTIKVILILVFLAGIAGASILINPIIGGLGGVIVVSAGIYHFTGMKGGFILAVLVVLSVVAVGTVGGYGGFLNSALGPAASGVESSLGDGTEEVLYQASQLKNKVMCLASGPGCFRELSLNSTQQPGSEDVGETYRLEVEGPTISGSNDVRFMNYDSPIPITFRVRNPRHGLKGITAKNVDYRLKVQDSKVLGSDEAYCQTGWRDLNKSGDLSRILEESDLDQETKDDLIENNDNLLPGETATPLDYTGENRLTLGECGLMNPVQTTAEAILQIKYNYSANSFINIEAKDRSQVDGGFSRINSKTPDTPVETSIRTTEPVTFRIPDGTSTRIARPFTVRTDVSTDERDLDFKIRGGNFELEDSNLTMHREDNCDGLTRTGGDTYKLSSEAADRIEQRQDEVGWYNHRISTPEASCQFVLDNPYDIAPTGETLTMTAEVDYTVRKEENSEGFNIRNTLCSRQNCPLLVPLNSSNLNSRMATEIDLEEDLPTDKEDNEWKEDYWDKEYAYCNEPQDAQAGCSVVDSFSINDRTNPKDRRVAEETLAIKLKGENYDNIDFTDNAKEYANESGGFIAVEPEILKCMWNSDDPITYSEDRQRLEFDTGSDKTKSASEVC